jgi:hypothetical protein
MKPGFSPQKTGLSENKAKELLLWGEKALRDYTVLLQNISETSKITLANVRRIGEKFEAD